MGMIANGYLVHQVVEAIVELHNQIRSSWFVLYSAPSVSHLTSHGGWCHVKNIDIHLFLTQKKYSGWEFGKLPNTFLPHPAKEAGKVSLSRFDLGGHWHWVI